VAELYPPGIQRIFYRTNKDEDLVVTAKLLDPNLISLYFYIFSKVPGYDRLYYAEVDFYMEGIWMITFYENGVEKTSQAYNTKKLPAEADIKVIRRDKGPNVIG